MGLVFCMGIGLVLGWIVAAVQEVDEGIFARMGLGLLAGAVGSLVVAFLSDTITLNSISLPGIAFTVLATVVSLGMYGLSREKSGYESS